MEKEALSIKKKIKYLGVTIDNKLNVNDHIQDKCQKATTILNMLKRNLYYAPKSVKEKAYIACVLPIIEYASVCWSPTSKKSNNSIEMVHHNAAKFVSNSYPRKGHYETFSISKVLKNLNWVSLEQRRKQARLIMAYKIINRFVILEPNMLPKAEIKRPDRKGYGKKIEAKYQLKELHSRLDITNSTFFYETPRLWNTMITSSQAISPSAEAFKSHFSKK